MSKRMIHVAERRLINFYFIFSIFLFCLLWRKRRQSTSVSLLVSFEIQPSLFPSGGRIPDTVFWKFSLLCFQRVLYRTKNSCWFQHSENCTACAHDTMKMAYVASIGDWPASTTDFFRSHILCQSGFLLCFHLKFARAIGAWSAKIDPLAHALLLIAVL